MTALAILALPASAVAQAPVAVDDGFDVPAGGTLVVDPRGVLENDTDASGEDLPPAATAELRVDAGSGALSLSADGSFTYTPAIGFPGSDTFVYRVIDGAEVSNDATVTLNIVGCTSTAPVATCWVEDAYFVKLLELGSGGISEGFEDDAAWGSARSPSVAPSIVSQGVTWAPTSSVSEITTGVGAARTGDWGVFSLPHGDPTGGPFDPLRDGLTGTMAAPMLGVGGWITSNTGGAQVEFVLKSPPNPPVTVDFDEAGVSSGHKFFGVIDTRGFTSFEVAETEGVVEDQKFIFGDDFTLGIPGATSTSSTTTSTSVTTSTTLLRLCASTPAVGCRVPAARKSQVQIKDDADNDIKDKFKWKWKKGAKVLVEAFGDPVNGSGDYRVCLYDSSAADQPIMEATMPPGGICDDRPCWDARGDRGFSYRDKQATPDGITKAKMKAAEEGKPQVQIVGQGVELPMPALSLTLPVTVQYVVNEGATSECWQTTFTEFKKNDERQFKAKGP